MSPGEVVVDADPVHLAVDADLLLADDRDVVLGHARDDAGAAAGAGRQVDRHAPLVALVLVVRVQRERLRKRVRHVLDDFGLVRVLRERDDARGMAAFHRVVVLRRGEQIPIAGLDDLEAGAEPGRVRRAQQVGVERLRFLARGADASGHAPAVAEKHRDRLVGLARNDEDRHARGHAAVAQLDDVAVDRGSSLGRALGLIHAAVSQVSFVSGLGASCSQPLLAKRPSQTVGSGRNTEFEPGGALAPALERQSAPERLAPAPRPARASAVVRCSGVDCRRRRPRLRVPPARQPEPA